MCWPDFIAPDSLLKCKRRPVFGTPVTRPLHCAEKFRRESQVLSFLELSQTPPGKSKPPTTETDLTRSARSVWFWQTTRIRFAKPYQTLSHNSSHEFSKFAKSLEAINRGVAYLFCGIEHRREIPLGEILPSGYHNQNERVNSREPDLTPLAISRQFRHPAGEFSLGCRSFVLT